jgi:hypothetical protein
MATCRDIPPEKWGQASDALIRFFSQRGFAADAEDLTQRALTAMLASRSLDIDHADNFIRVCYGFGHNILHEARRERLRKSREVSEAAIPPPATPRPGMQDADSARFLEQVVEIGRAQLSESDRKVLEDLIAENEKEAVSGAEANRFRVQLHRFRKKLAKLTGLVRNEV